MADLTILMTMAINEQIKHSDTVTGKQYFTLFILLKK